MYKCFLKSNKYLFYLRETHSKEYICFLLTNIFLSVCMHNTAEILYQEEDEEEEKEFKLCSHTRWKLQLRAVIRSELWKRNSRHWTWSSIRQRGVRHQARRRQWEEATVQDGLDMYKTSPSKWITRRAFREIETSLETSAYAERQLAVLRENGLGGRVGATTTALSFPENPVTVVWHA